MNLVTECVVVLKPKESYYERSRMYCDIHVEQVAIFINSEQISDILAFIKVQKYTTFFGKHYRFEIESNSKSNFFFFSKRSLS